MFRVINAKSASGRSFTFSVKNGRFADVEVQDRPHFHPHAESLAELTDLAATSSERLFDAAGATIVPAGIDAHIHSRDPGLTHKEDWRTVATSAWRGGVTAVCDMPNTIPATMTRADVEAKAEIAAASGVGFNLFVGVGASNVKTVGELLSDKSLPIAGLKVYYGQSTGELMYDDLESLGRSLPADGERLIVFHSEDQCSIDCAHERHSSAWKEVTAGDKAAFKLHSVVRSSESAHASTRVILEWAKGYGRPIHIAHVSTPLEIELIAAAKAKGVQVTGEVAPHHLLFSDADYARLGGLLKMNPPVRSATEVEALGRLFGQGAVDIFATDHAPHTIAEKQRPLTQCPSGVPSLEFYYQLLFEVAQRYGLNVDKAVEMAATRPAQLFGFPRKGLIAAGYDADFVWLSAAPFKVKQEEVVSKCGWTPYDGMTLPRDVFATWAQGRRVYCNKAADISRLFGL